MNQLESLELKYKIYEMNLVKDRYKRCLQIYAVQVQIGNITRGERLYTESSKNVKDQRQVF